MITKILENDGASIADLLELLLSENSRANPYCQSSPKFSCFNIIWLEENIHIIQRH